MLDASLQHDLSVLTAHHCIPTVKGVSETWIQSNYWLRGNDNLVSINFYYYYTCPAPTKNS